MKKFILAVILIAAFVGSAHAQTVVVERPGLFTDLSTALIGIPAAAVTGFVEGTVESIGSLITGSTTMVTTSAPPCVIAPAPIVVPNNQVVVTSPIVTGVPSTTVVTTTSAPIAVPGGTFIPTPTTRVITNYGNGTSVTVTRPASGYELGTGTVYPVAPGHRVGPSPHVNPYIYRPNGF